MVRDTTIASGRGPVAVHLPDGIDDVQKFARLPLVVYLHGYGGTADGFDAQFGLHAGHIDKNNMIVLMPDGRRDELGRRYWSAWGDWVGGCDAESTSYASYGDGWSYSDSSEQLRRDATDGKSIAPPWAPENCRREETQPPSELPAPSSSGGAGPEAVWARTGCADDDAAYLRELVAAAANLWRVDFGRIYAYGHSNGAAMAYRLACEASDLFAGVIAFAGVPPPADSAVGCAPSRPLRVLHIHATQDFTVPYAGALEATAAFTDYNGCRSPLPPGAAVAGATAGAERSLDLSERVIGKETEVFAAAGCATGSEVTLWKLLCENHNPRMTARYRTLVMEWLLQSDHHCDPLDAGCRVRRAPPAPPAPPLLPGAGVHAHVHAANFTTYVIAIVLYSILAVGAVGICGMAVQCWLRRRRNLNGPARPAAYTSSGRTVMPSRRRELYASSSAL